jgi:hypothetical protein
MTWADENNEFLEAGGIIELRSRTKLWEYRKKHAGMFYMGADGNLYVKRGKSADCLSSCNGTRLLVSVGFYEESKP